jgi:uncharacterized protein
MIIGVLSDTHGTLHPRVVPLFREAQVEMILHAGDVGTYGIITELSNLAPVKAVFGNVDVQGNVALLPGEISLEVEGVSLYMTHVGGKPEAWHRRLPRPRPGVAICGHSHIPLLEEREGTLFLNPGAAGTRRRFNIPPSVALLRIEYGTSSAEIIGLEA